ncbi:MAG: ABC transporter substrate-binding protein [Planctomycetes bacterium]|nr:ABC transporter substrate-binding protein [Planctomycetota bacterium]
MIFRTAATALAGGLALAACGGGEPASVRTERSPRRIVAGSVFAAETLLAIAPRERIAAVHELAANAKFSLVAAEVAGFPRVGAEPEQLLAVRPDLVVVDAFTKPETLAILASAAVPVLLVPAPRSFEDIATNVRRVGEACRLEAAAERLVAAMNARLAELAARRAEFAQFELMSLDGGLHTLGRGSLFDAVVCAAGAVNLAAERGAGPFRIMTTESVLAWRPQVLVIEVRADSAAEERKWVDRVPGFELLPAVQRGQIVFLDAALLGTTSHHLVDAVAALQDALAGWGPK